MIQAYLLQILILQSLKRILTIFFIKINNWLKSNLLSLNFLLFITKNSQKIDMQTLHENKQINNTYSTKFLRLIIDNSLSWKVHID